MQSKWRSLAQKIKAFKEKLQLLQVLSSLDGTAVNMASLESFTAHAIAMSRCVGTSSEKLIRRTNVWRQRPYIHVL
jgi:hypothetical protein